MTDPSDKTASSAAASAASMAAGGLLLAALLFSSFVMRGPVTAVGPVSDEIRSVLGIGWSAYGFLTALPVAAFGVFSFAAPWAVGRLGLLGALVGALAALTLGALLRVVPDWWVLLAGTLLVGAGIAVMNVLLPVSLKTGWPARAAGLMGLYTGLVGVSGAVGGLTSAPLLDWGGALAAPMGFWAAAAAVATAFVFFASRSAAASGRFGGAAPGGVGFRALLVNPLAWALTGVMGLQSLTIYTAAAWMPPYWHAQGLAPSETGFWLFVYLLSGLPASLLTPRFMTWVRSEAAAAVILALLYLAGLAGWLAGGAWLLSGSVAAGAAQGAMLSVAFLLMAKKSPDLRRMLGISSMAQGIGYLGAGCGPSIFAALYEGTGAWAPAFLFFAAVIVLWGAAGCFAARRPSL